MFPPLRGGVYKTERISAADIFAPFQSVLPVTAGNMKKLKNFFSNLDIAGAAIAAVMLVIGILFIIFPQGLLKIVCYVSGAIVVIGGLTRFILGFKAETEVHAYDIITDIFIVAAGVLLIISPDFIAELVTVLLGLLLLVDSVLKLIDSRQAYKSGGEWIPGVVIGAVCAVLGIVIIFNPFATTRLLMVFVGISMVLDAVCSLAVYIYFAVRDGKEQPPRDNVTDI